VSKTQQLMYSLLMYLLNSPGNNLMLLRASQRERLVDTG
jgi:hypothetical protein